MSRAQFSRGWVWSGVALVVLALLGLFFFTPGDLLRKADYIGAAVCHRRAVHSFFIAGHQLPLCERCTGTFSGALTGLLVQWGLWQRRRSFRFPRTAHLIVVGLLAAPWVLDGVNSASVEFLGTATGVLGYVSQPWGRFLSGILMGMAMSVALVPSFNQVLWRDVEDAPTLRSWRELLTLLVIEGGVAAAILSLKPVLLYPVAFYSVSGVVAMFVCLGAMVFVMALERENAFGGWREAWVPLVWGGVFAILVIGGMDALRLHLTGTLDGLPGLR